MKKNKIIFLILHYYVIEETQKCVDSIQKNMSNKEYEIVIVDNASANGTGKKLQEIYSDNKRIHVIINEENLGFARGNNVGFKFAKEQLNATFIVMLNNDTELLQSNFSNLIEDEYKKSKFAVLGPKIILKDKSINSICTKLPSAEEIRKRIRNTKIKYVLKYMHLEKVIKIISYIIKKLKKVEPTEEPNVNKRQKNIILHGCCLIFSPKYIEKFDGIDDKTFLYCEEELLFIRLIKNKMISIYNPNIKIYHAEDAATNAISKNNRNKELFVYRNLIKSYKILLEELKELEKEV